MIEADLTVYSISSSWNLYETFGGKSWYVLAIIAFELFKKFCFEIFNSTQKYFIYVLLIILYTRFSLYLMSLKHSVVYSSISFGEGPGL